MAITTQLAHGSVLKSLLQEADCLQLETHFADMGIDDLVQPLALACLLAAFMNQSFASPKDRGNPIICKDITSNVFVQCCSQTSQLGLQWNVQCKAWCPAST